MSKREDVLSALFTLLSGVGGATVARNMSLPNRIPAAGLVILRDGTPGEPEVSLSPLTYHYEHEATVEVIVQGQATQDSLFDAVCVAIGQRLAPRPLALRGFAHASAALASAKVSGHPG